MAELLSADGAARSLNVSADAFRQLVHDRAVCAPTHFTKDAATGDLSALWLPIDLSVRPEDGVATRANRASYFAALLDEMRYRLWTTGDLVIMSSDTGRPMGNGANYPLGQRVGDLRAAHRIGRINETEQGMFEQLPNWYWDHTDAAWNTRFERVSRAWPDLNHEDRIWLHSQRRRYKVLRPNWRERLDANPEMFTHMPRSRVDQFCAAAKVWLRQHPGSTMYSMPYNATVVSGDTTYPIGRRATYYRRRWAGLEGINPLSDYDVRKIEQLPGWDWEVSPTHRINALKREDLQHLPHIRRLREEARTKGLLVA